MRKRIATVITLYAIIMHAAFATDRDLTFFKEINQATEDPGLNSDPIDGASNSEFDVSDYNATVNVSTGSKLNVRNGPGTTHAIIGAHYRGDTVRVTHNDGVWGRIAWSAGQIAYVHGDYLQRAENPESFSNPVDGSRTDHDLLYAKAAEKSANKKVLQDFDAALKAQSRTASKPATQPTPTTTSSAPSSSSTAPMEHVKPERADDPSDQKFYNMAADRENKIIDLENRAASLQRDIDTLGTSGGYATEAMRAELDEVEKEIEAYRRSTSTGASSPHDLDLGLSLPEADSKSTQLRAEDVARDYIGPSDNALTREEALAVLERDFDTFDAAHRLNPRNPYRDYTDGLIGDSDLVAVLEGEGYTDEQKAAAAYFYLNPEDFGRLDRASRPDALGDKLVSREDIETVPDMFERTDKMARALRAADSINNSPASVNTDPPEGSDRRLFIMAADAGNPEALERFDAEAAGVSEDQVISILGRDFDVFQQGGGGITRDKLADIVLREEYYSEEQRAVAAYFLGDSTRFDDLERSQRGDGNWTHDGAIGEGDITDAGGVVGPSRQEILDQSRSNLRTARDNGVISSEQFSQTLTSLDALVEVSPAEFNALHRAFAVGQVGTVVYQAAVEGDSDAAIETAFDAAAPIIVKQVVTRLAGGALGGPIGVGTAALSLLLAFTPLDTSEFRQLSYSELSGEINERGQRIYPGGYGTQIDGSGLPPN